MPSRFFVASARAWDLLVRAKHLFVAATFTTTLGACDAFDAVWPRSNARRD